jgi:hypothetical protein
MDGNFGIRLENNVSMVKETDTKCNFGEKQTSHLLFDHIT